MALNGDNVRVGVTGALYVDDLGGTVPTGTGSATTGYTDLGYISEDGVTETQAGSGDTEPIKAWQGGATVRTLRTPTDENPSWSCVLLETKLETVELYYGTTVTTDVSEGSFEIDASATRPHHTFILDVVDGAELYRVFIPNGVVTEVGERVYRGTEAIGFEVTIEGERENTLGYNAKVWSTALAA